MTQDTNLATVSEAAASESVLATLRKLTPAGIRAASRKLAARRDPEHPTPWTWADEGGLFYGSGGAWLYYQLPLVTVAAGSTAFGDLLTTLARQLDGRRAHLLMYGWEEPPTVAPGLSDAHEDYILSCLRMLVPGHILVVGVALTEDPAHAKQHAKLSGVFTEVVDRSLGEWVPDLDGYDTDRDLVAGLLGAAGGTPVAGTSLDMLESWYSLGVSVDLTVTEKDDSIVVRDADILEFVSLRSFHDQAPEVPSPMISPRSGGSAVVSARGELTVRTVHRNGIPEHVGTLSGCSIVLGRRTQDLEDVLDDVVEAIDGVEAKPLPMRQLLALEETLPTSPVSVDPHLFNVDAERLARVGFREPIPAGDRGGLLVGLVEPDFSYPLYLDMLNTPAYLLGVVGAAGSGKTFLLEHLAVQAALAGRPTMFVRASGDAGHVLVGAADAAVTDTPVPGLLDPFARLRPDLAVDALVPVLAAALPQLTVDDLDAVRTGLGQAVAAGVRDTASALRGVADPKLAAVLVRFTRTPVGVLLCASRGTTTLRTRPEVWDLAGILAGVDDPAVRSAMSDLTVAVAQYRARGGLLAADEVGDWSPGTTARAVSAGLGAECGALAVSAADDAPLTSGRLPAPTTTIVLACPDRQADRLLARQVPDAHREVGDWLTGAGPVIEDGTVYQPALGVLLDGTGRDYAIAVGPVPVHLTAAFTRAAASVYAADVRAG